jgi:hypothetical protein
MKKYLKRTLRISGGILGLVLILLIGAGLLFYFDKPLARKLSQSYLSEKTGLAVTVGGLDYRISPLRITITSLGASRETADQKVDIVIKRVEASGDFKRFIKGETPAFDSVEFDGADVRLEQKAASKGQADYQALISEAAGVLEYSRKFSAKKSDVVLSLPAGTLNLEGVDLSLTETGETGTFAYVLNCTNAEADGEDGAVRVRTQMSSAGKLILEPTAAWEGRLDFESLSAAVPGFDSPLKIAEVKAAGEVSLNEKKLSFSELTVSAPELAEISGDLAAGFGQNPFLHVNAKARIDNLGWFVSYVASRLPPALHDVRVQGKTNAALTYDLAASPQGKQENIEATLSLDGIRLDYEGFGRPLRAGLSGQLKVEGYPPDLRVTGDIRAGVERISGENFQAGKARLHLQVKWHREVAEIPEFEASLGTLSFVLPGEKRLSFKETRLKGRARLDLSRRVLALDSLEVRVPPLLPVRLSAAADLGPPRLRQFTLATEGQSIPALVELFAPFVPESLKGWDLGGTAAFSLRAQNQAANRGRWNFSGDLGLIQAKFSDPSFTAAGDGLEPRVHLEGQYDFPKGVLSLSGSLEISRGESLWKNYYVSWSKDPVRAGLTADWSFASKSLDLTAGRVVSPALGEIRVKGSASLDPALSFNLQTSSRLSLESLYALFPRTGAPGEGGLAVKGTFTADAEILKKKDSLSITGRAALSGGSLASAGSKFSLRGLAADVPFRIETGGASDSPERQTSAENGSIRAEEIEAPLFSFKSVELVLHSATNSFQFEPFSLNLFGGRAEFGKTSVSLDPSTRAFEGLSSLRLRDIDISRIPLETSRFKLSGTGAAEFSQVQISPQKISAPGRAKVDIFGGKVFISNFSVVNPFSGGRKISFDTDLIDLDLKKLTDAVPFGEVTGIIRGEIRDLTFSYGQPERFEMDLESVKKKGVPQRFSLKAVDNLSVISSGRQASMGTGKFWMRFVHSFRYAKIGIECTLRNDTFTLGGTIKEKGVEYLVKRPALFGINVIDRDPGKKISFKDMMSRLERVGRAETNK